MAAKKKAGTKKAAKAKKTAATPAQPATVPTAPAAATTTAAPPAAATTATGKKKRVRKPRDPAAPKRSRRKVDLAGTFNIKVKLDGVNERHLHGLAVKNSTTRKKISRNDLRDYLTNGCKRALEQLSIWPGVDLALQVTANAQQATPAAPATDAVDDLLG